VTCDTVPLNVDLLMFNDPLGSCLIVDSCPIVSDALLSKRTSGFTVVKFGSKASAKNNNYISEVGKKVGLGDGIFVGIMFIVDFGILTEFTFAKVTSSLNSNDCFDENEVTDIEVV
jgi:hypothetical protein